ncbi:tryptophan halogenase family protein [Marinimicrobium sp. ABcell2]|uniref:tryptophan halogenase family protein n=1 Tax=Marinimicrobium sp. ABcell2 TaxID=3069751 RepID=UPI0027B6B6A7|nr:tryptophan halogenase family protein [Marinimicrobium sp. ABcell2]MDQ2075957.1 tryptophan 7-halogenase [Marinimicrobium sp. ABcell2]
MTEERVKKIVIIGGGSAGWLVAGRLANRFKDSTTDNGLDLTLIESGTIPTLGVGEGTWPSMRSTLNKIGIPETQFMTHCDASFKQGSKFIDWQQGKGEFYYHPFELPAPYADDFIGTLGTTFSGKSFAECVCPTVALDSSDLAPKLITSASYAHVVNYGYHLDANKFGTLLRDHALNHLGVKHLVDTVEGVDSDERGYIKAVTTASGQRIEGDLFIDCSGFASILMKGHYKIPFVSCEHRLFNNSAIAVQIPYSSDAAPIQSYTHSTAKSSGWIWDIGLTSRRGVGYTYSSAHCTAEAAQLELETYAKGVTANWQDLSYRNIKFNPGHLKKFWHKNCVAIGVSSGFLEPLEASALVMIEQASDMLADNLPATYSAMSLIEKKYNERFSRHWQHIIEFLKLHYVTSQRDGDYWADNRQQQSWPEELVEKMEFWKHFSPSRYDDTALRELFPTASYQYVLYGMGQAEPTPAAKLRKTEQMIIRQLEDSFRKAAQLVRSLPTNRELLNALNTHNKTTA